MTAQPHDRTLGRTPAGSTGPALTAVPSPAADTRITPGTPARPSSGLIDVPPGLAGVRAADTAIGDVRGAEGFYHYRQYSAIDLALHRSLEDVWHLLFEGHLPTADELAVFRAQIDARRDVPAELAALLPAMATGGPGTGLLPRLRTALSMLGSLEDFQPVYGADPARRRDDAMRVAAITPTLLAALHRLRHGQQPLAPRPGLTAAGQWLYLLTGIEPDDRDPADVEAVDRYLVCTVDHGFNASTFTSRVVTSTGADVVAAVCAGIGAFTGPLHGGAPDRALAALDEIGSPDRADAWVRARVAAGERIMGFGHAVYRTDDPRAAMLRDLACARGGELADFAAQVEQTVLDVLAQIKPGRSLNTNVEYWAGVVMAQAGLAPELFTPTFTVSRVIGWTANVLEQAADPKIIRPSARYVGPPAPQPVPPAA